MKRIALILIAVAFAVSGVAQRMPERGLVRKGNRQFKRENYERSVDSYTRALQADSTCFEAAYDLGSALFRSERYERAEQTLQRAVRDTLRTDIDRSEAYFNLGNAQFAQKKLKEALASYREAMRFNPSDREAKWNYAYTKKLLEQQQDQDQNKDQNKDQNQDQNKDQNQDQNQNKDQDQNQNQDQNKDKDRNQQDQDKGQDQQPKEGMSDREQQAMLDAIQAQEDKTQDKLKEKKGILIRGTKNW